MTPIHPLSDESADEQVKEIFQAIVPGGQVAPFFRMLAHSPGVLRAYNQLTAAIWAESAALPARLKDLAYLRASILNGCDY
jgi:alkylhydroperoxidase family enzyme